MLVVIGDLVADLIVLGGARLQRGTDNPAEVRLTRGGSAANVAVAAAARHPVRFIGRIGDDLLGDTLARELESAGVEVRVQRSGRTGSIVILVDDTGERTMITDRGAAAELAAIDPDWLAGATWLHLPLYGFQPPGSRRAVTDAAAAVAASGARVSLDLSSVATMRALGREALDDIVGALAPSVVFANADEASCAAELGVATSAVSIVKRGGDPVLVTVDGETAEVAVDRVDDVVDSTGAGDAFAAGYIAAALAGANPVESASRASELARAALVRPGAL